MSTNVWTVALLLSTVVLARADEPQTTYGGEYYGAELATEHIEAEPCDSCGKRQGPLRRFWSARSERKQLRGAKPKRTPRFRWFGLHCFGDFNDYSCGSIHSEKAFICGSCRTFFGEKCLASEPVDPIVVYRHNQRLFPRSGDHVVPGSARIPIFGNTPESQALYPEELPTLKQHHKAKRGCPNCR